MTTNAEVQKTFETWINAVASGKASEVMKLYADDAVLLPTLLGEICDTPALRQEYFEHFTAKLPQGKIDANKIRVHGDIAINSGHYTFAFKDGSSAAARFSFVYQKRGDSWMIVDHHSSLNPGGHEKKVEPTHAHKG